MQYNQYRFKFYINATHSIYISGVLGQSHSHTWEIIINTVKIKETFILFKDIEYYVDSFLSKYQDVYINTVEPFTTLNPTLENICQYFKECIQKMLYDNGWLLLSIEMSETPTRSYIISLSTEISLNNASYNSESGAHVLSAVDRLVNEKLTALSKTMEPLPQEEASMPDKKKNRKKLRWYLLIGALIFVVVLVFLIYIAYFLNLI